MPRRPERTFSVREDSLGIFNTARDQKIGFYTR